VGSGDVHPLENPRRIRRSEGRPQRARRGRGGRGVRPVSHLPPRRVPVGVAIPPRRQVSWDEGLLRVLGRHPPGRTDRSGDAEAAGGRSGHDRLGSGRGEGLGRGGRESDRTTAAAELEQVGHSFPHHSRVDESEV